MYNKKTWKKGEIIEADALNNMEDGIATAQQKADTAAAQQGAKGDKGDTGAQGIPGEQGAQGAQGTAGIGLTAIALTTDADGKITGGKWTDTEGTEHDITFTATAG